MYELNGMIQYNSEDMPARNAVGGQEGETAQNNNLGLPGQPLCVSKDFTEPCPGSVVNLVSRSPAGSRKGEH